MKCCKCKKFGLLVCKYCGVTLCSGHIQLELHGCPHLIIKESIKLPEAVKISKVPPI